MANLNVTDNYEELSRMSNTSLPMPEPPLYIVVVASILYGLTFLLGIFGNLMVVIVLYKYKTMRNRMNFFLVNLSIADLFILMVCMPSAAVDLFAKEVWYFGETLCKIVPYIEHVVTLSSVLTIFAITWDRYKGICFPLKYDDGRAHNMSVQLVTIWTLSSIVSLPTIFIPVFRDSAFRDGTPIQVCRMPITEEWHLAYFIAIFAIFFCFMFFMLLVLYGKICRALSQRKEFINQSADRYAKKILKERRQMIQLMLVVVAMFFVCLVPQRAISLWLIFASKSHIMSLKLEGYLLLKTFPRVLVYMNSAINPIIYNFVSTKYRNAFSKLLCDWRGKQIKTVVITQIDRTEDLELKRVLNEDSRLS